MGEKSGRKEEGRGIRRKTSHRNEMRGLRHVTERLAVDRVAQPTHFTLKFVSKTKLSRLDIALWFLALMHFPFSDVDK